MGFLKGYLKPAKKSDTSAAADVSEKRAGENAGPSASAQPSGPNSGWATPRASRPASIYPAGDFRNSTMGELNDIKCDVMVNWLHQQQLELMWSAGSINEGVVLKKGRGDFMSCPPELMAIQGDLFESIKLLNVRVSRLRSMVLAPAH